MIVAFTSGGQLGNQLMFEANLMATSMKYHISYKNIAFKAKKYFEIKDSEQSKYISYHKNLCKILAKYMYGIKRITSQNQVPGINVFLNEDAVARQFVIQSDKDRLALFHCWPYLDIESLYEFQDEVRNAIRPKLKLYEEGKNKFEKVTEYYKDATFIGIHIRRKDYKDFLGGRYYYGYGVYKKRMEEAAKATDGDVVFLIFSDEHINLIELENPALYRVWVSNNTAIVDLVMMSLCDFLIGPPSTFSGWASFWGKTPKHIMIDDQKQITDLKKKNFGVYMVDVMDNELDNTGRKILTYYEEGRKMAE